MKHVAKKKTKPAKQKRAVSPPPVVATFNDYKPKPSAMNEQDFMSSLLGDMEKKVASDLPLRNRKRKPSRASPSPPPSSEDDGFDNFRINADAYADTSSDGLMDDFTAHNGSDQAASSPFKRARTVKGQVTPAVRRLEELSVGASSDGFDAHFDDSFDDISMDDITQDEEETKPGPAKPTIKTERIEKLPEGLKKDTVKVKKEDGVPSWLNIHSALSVKSEDTLGPLAASSSNINSANVNALEEDGSLRFFWIDYFEQGGEIYFIGKIKDKTSGTWLSCCITVEGMQRNLFVLPRERRFGKEF